MKLNMKSNNETSKQTEALFNAITDIPDEYILEASDHVFKQSKAEKQPLLARLTGRASGFRAFRYVTPIAAALCLSLLAGIFFWPAPIAISAYAIAEAHYPAMTAYPIEEDFYDSQGNWDYDAYSVQYTAWETDQQEQNRPDGFADGIESFIAASSQQFVAGDDNIVYSPLNVYMALGVLTETSDGNSRDQLLNVLGSTDLESLRRQASDIWNVSYNNDGLYTSILANSLWLNEDLPVNEDTLQTIADNYYTSSFSGPMGSRKFDKALQNWLNENTGGLLEEQVENETFTETIVLSIASAIDYSTTWSNRFSAAQTASATFHTPDGAITCDFMNQTSQRRYYWGEQFTAVKQHEQAGGSMLFLLPNEDVSASSLLHDPEVLNFIFSDLSGRSWDNSDTYTVNFSVPKFDITTRLSLIDGLKQLGITDIFDAETADFSSLTNMSGELELQLSQIDHTARITIDEDGYDAAAYTLISADTSSAEPESQPLDFVLDRPFLFVTLSPDGLPMFIGIVNQPGR